MTKDEIREYVQREGIVWAMAVGIDADRVEDDELRHVWYEAAQAIEKAHYILFGCAQFGGDM